MSEAALSSHTTIAQRIGGTPKGASPGWSKILMSKIVYKVAWEPIQSFDPMKLHEWLKLNEKDKWNIMSLFSISAAIRMYVPDTADVGAYSSASLAMTYEKVLFRTHSLWR